ncbi:MAG: cohesin domain-containing protein [bacterium]|nr:cohesin domain-containing protein [bacterium]
MIRYSSYEYGLVSWLLVLFSIFYFLFSGTAHAASFQFSFDGPKNVAVGEEFAVAAFLDTDQPVNAYVLNFGYDEKSAQLLGFDTSRSIIDVWQSQPTVLEPKVIGGSTVPFQGTRGELLTMRFKALREGAFLLRYNNPALYLANGKGTKVIPATQEYGAKIVTVGEPISDKRLAISDHLPEITLISFTDDPFDQDHRLLSYSVRDGGAGIISVAYRSRAWFFWGRIQPAINPSTVPANAWSAMLIVTDGNGNMVRKTIYDWPSFAKGPMALLILLGLVTAFIINKVRKDIGIIIK